MTIRNLMTAVLLLVFTAPGLTSCGNDSGDHAVADGPAVQVRAMTVGTVAEPSRLELSGELVAKNRFEVASKVAGRIASFPVTEGTKVRRGDLLVQVDSPELVSALAQSGAAEQAAQLEMETATRQAERFRRLAADDVVTPRDLEMVELGEAGARASYERARAMREMSERNLGYAELRAPRDGVVVRRMARPGDLATTNLRATPPSWTG
jgi:RND family efflux transporter MFP subunit